MIAVMKKSFGNGTAHFLKLSLIIESAPEKGSQFTMTLKPNCNKNIFVSMSKNALNTAEMFKQ
jgi:hypothetical protein